MTDNTPAPKPILPEEKSEHYYARAEKEAEALIKDIDENYSGLKMTRKMWLKLRLIRSLTTFAKGGKDEKLP